MSQKNNPTNIKNPCEQYLDDEIDLYELWLIIKKRQKVILISTILTTLIGFIYLLFATPVYKTEAKLGLVISLPRTVVDKFFITGIRVNYGDILNDFDLKKQILNPYWKNLKDYYGDKLEENPKDVVNEVINVYSRKGFWYLEVKFPSNGTIAFKIATNYIIKVKEAVEDFYKNLIKNLIYINQKQIREISNKLQLLERYYNDYLEGKIKSIPWIVIISSTLNPPKGKSIKELNLWKFQVQTEILKQQLEELYKHKQFLENYKTILTLNAIKVVEPPLEPKKPYKPNKLVILIVSFISGLLLGIFLVFFLEYLEESRKQLRGKTS